VLLSSRKVLVHEDKFTSPCPSTTKSLLIVNDFAFSKQSVMYDHTKSINSVTAKHKDTVKSVLLTDVRYYLLIFFVDNITGGNALVLSNRVALHHAQLVLERVNHLGM